MKRLLFILLLLCNVVKADIVTLKMVPEILVAPKSTPVQRNTILGSAAIRKLYDSTNNIAYGEFGLQVDTLNKDEPWKLVFFNPVTKLSVDASDKMKFEILASSRVGTLQTVTPAVVGKTFLLGDIIEYRVVKISTKIGDKDCELYTAFNVRYRVVRNDTGDHWYPTTAVSFRAPGSYGDSTCVATFTLTPPRIVASQPTFWMPVNRNLIISQ